MGMTTTTVKTAVQNRLARGSSPSTTMSAAASGGAACSIRAMSPRSAGTRVRLPHLAAAFPRTMSQAAASGLIAPELVPGQSGSVLVHVTCGNACFPSHPGAVLVLGGHRHGTTLEQPDLHRHGAMCRLDLQHVSVQGPLGNLGGPDAERSGLPKQDCPHGVHSLR